MGTEMLPADTPLCDAKKWLLAHIEKGAACPCCTQFARVYRRKIISRYARSLILMWITAGQDWCHVPSLDKGLVGDGGGISLLRYWGLVEDGRERREDGGKAGWYRITDEGRRFVLGETRVPKYIRLYDSRLLSVDRTESVDIHEAIGTKFNYDDLMRGI